MTAININSNLLHIAVKAAIKAGSAILEVYSGSDFEISFKSDHSPITLADKSAHEIIQRELASTDIPLLSEEGGDIPFQERGLWNQYWLVDPLDGTKEFIRRNGEFTVNIALIESGEPVLGVVYCPVNKALYFGVKEAGAWKWSGGGCEDTERILAEAQALPLESVERPYRIIASRSHRNNETVLFIKKHIERILKFETISIGSSLKLCLIAEGSADIYPRFGPTMEWDTAAGHAIINAAGGRVTLADRSGSLTYNKPDLLNPWFIAYAPHYKAR